MNDAWSDTCVVLGRALLVVRLMLILARLPLCSEMHVFFKRWNRLLMFPPSVTTQRQIVYNVKVCSRSNDLKPNQYQINEAGGFALLCN